MVMTSKELREVRKKEKYKNKVRDKLMDFFIERGPNCGGGECETYMCGGCDKLRFFIKELTNKFDIAEKGKEVVKL